jgi:hypothetical protein
MFVGNALHDAGRLLLNGDGSDGECGEWQNRLEQGRREELVGGKQNKQAERVHCHKQETLPQTMPLKLFWLRCLLSEIKRQSRYNPVNIY